MSIQNIIPNQHSFEGVEFVSYEGIFYKGCTRCGGTGHYSFNGYDSDCYKCGNTGEKLGDELGTLEQAQKWAHGIALSRAAAERRRNARAEAILAKMEAKREALKAVDPEVHAFLTGLNVNGDYDSKGNEIAAGTERDSFLISMWEQLYYGIHADRPFTERMVAAARKSMEKRQAKAVEAAANPAPSGAVVVTGEITSYRVVEGDYGTSYKVNVKSDEGFRVWVSLAKPLVDSAYNEWMATLADDDSPYNYGPEYFLQGITGRRLSFTATLEPSRDDVSFAFGSRPRKASWL